VKGGTSGVPYGPNAQLELEGVAVNADGSRVYASGHSLSGAGQALIIDTSTDDTVPLPLGNASQGLALSSDGRTLYVANTGSNTITTVYSEGSSIRTAAVGAAPMGVAVAAVPQFCDGDCNGDGAVTVDEVIQAVDIALGQQAVTTCIAADSDDDDTVTVDEVLRGVNNALNGCPS
jgi:YVTN family beta-propeller protein